MSSLDRFLTSPQWKHSGEERLSCLFALCVAPGRPTRGTRVAIGCACSGTRPLADARPEEVARTRVLVSGVLPQGRPPAQSTFGRWKRPGLEAGDHVCTTLHQLRRPVSRRSLRGWGLAGERLAGVAETDATRRWLSSNVGERTATGRGSPPPPQSPPRFLLMRCKAGGGPGSPPQPRYPTRPGGPFLTASCLWRPLESTRVQVSLPPRDCGPASEPF